MALRSSHLWKTRIALDHIFRSGFGDIVLAESYQHGVETIERPEELRRFVPRSDGVREVFCDPLGHDFLQGFVFFLNVKGCCGSWELYDEYGILDHIFVEVRGKDVPYNYCFVSEVDLKHPW